ncbi:hypothetical protein Y1Q_0000975 [Alligator mississippiensis]|uniref:Uncharacterized protein n=1 Tax=Alligator mississippiensis TaxID=8496 RepID=A0A151NEM4_ALLMI|nr:hypothetical protein Y1Q_0000975 [Alligator mississippiensis]
MEKLWQPPQEEHNKLGDRSPIALARVGGDNNFKVLRGSPWGSRGDLRLQDLPAFRLYGTERGFLTRRQRKQTLGLR